MRWWRRFRGRKATGDEPEASPQGPRRRDAARFDYREKLRLKCEGWPEFVELFSADVSRTGLFIESGSAVEVGERVAVQVDLPSGKSVEITGTVARRVDVARGRQSAGLGIQIDPPEGEAAEAYRQLLSRAEKAAPRPESWFRSDTLPPADKDDGEVLELDDITVVDRDLEPLEPARPSGPVSTIADEALQRPSGIIVGIDLGTTYTSVAAVVGSKVVILPREDERKSTPSVINFPDRDTILVGDREKIVVDPSRTIASPKRILGRPYAEPEVGRYTGQAPFRTLQGPDGCVLVEMWGDQYAIPQLVSHLLADAKAVAERHLGATVEQAVVSVPISFDDMRISHLRRAGSMAGLDIIAVIDEPSAAALANRFDPRFGGTVGIYDFGGGTFDFSVVDVSRGDFRVLATSGDTWLGGDDFDYVLATAAANQFWRKHQVDLRSSALEWQRLVFACEQAKRELTQRDRAAITVREVLRTAEGMVDLNFTINRAILAHASNSIISQSLETCDAALEAAELSSADLTAVYLSGGTTYIPCVRSAVESHFGVPVHTGVPPEHAVCLGAAIHAAQMQLSSERTLESR